MKLTEEFLFFWNGPFSQWYASDFVDFRGNKYNCAEQYMMANKAALFKDWSTYYAIMKTPNPAEQKSLGRGVRNFDKDEWESIALNVVTEGNYFKFTQSSDLYDLLLSSDDLEIVEASPYDRIWGIGMRETDRGVEDRMNWQGKNWLGHAIMNVRHMLKTGE